MDDPLTRLRDALRAFAAERDWAPYHSPKNLACALSVEASELLEHFQWMDEAASRTLAPETRAAVGQEAADVLLYLLQFADQLGLDLVAEAEAKMALNARRYSVATARGNADKARG